MSELKLSDFDPMLTASTAIANETFNVSTEEILIQLEDEDGEIHDITDVVFNPMTRAIHIKFSHDNEEDED